ncbi:MAG: sugar nucleotide-binding protein [Methylobacter sp.]|uniref:NAD-dependent epimerase/dehydratase family protein n=1 Tax=Methylobacter sp. TaxID=2051955 RepID=UPI00272EFCE5|nr:sugar nucleotide-binding protein [Methylobacter sp.]MDP1665882.1 sugar nucleotide-binding protein [Methylobacter sp.]
MKIVVTGANGYVGTRLITIGDKHGHVIVVASRQPPIIQENLWIPFDIYKANLIELPSGTDAIVHLAANTLLANNTDKKSEINAAVNLIKAAKEVGAKFIFVSSQTARSDAPTAYGRTKWRIEQEVLSAGGWVVRPGQVYGGELRGLFGTLVSTVRRLPLLPAFIPAPKVQPIHVDDLAEGLLRIAERGDVPPDVYCLAAVAPVSFSILLDTIAKSRLRCWRGFLPVPVLVINALTFILGEKFRTRLGLERLQSLFNLPVMETRPDLNQLGLELRPLRSGMHPSGNDRRRRLLREGQAMLGYILKERPGSAVLRRYIRVIEQLRGGQALDLPKLFLGYPIFLSLLDESSWTNKITSAEYLWRLDAATVLAEATPVGAYRFLGRGHGVLYSLFSMTHAVLCEVCWRISRMLFSPLVRLTLSQEKGIL